jgi:hypothetical protein
VAVPTTARNTDGRWNYLAADMREWFKGLHAPRNGIPCCDEADVWPVDDVDWESKDGHYRVRLYGEWATAFCRCTAFRGSTTACSRTAFCRRAGWRRAGQPVRQAQVKLRI